MVIVCQCCEPLFVLNGLWRWSVWLCALSSWRRLDSWGVETGEICDNTVARNCFAQSWGCPEKDWCTYGIAYFVGMFGSIPVAERFVPREVFDSIRWGLWAQDWLRCTCQVAEPLDVAGVCVLSDEEIGQEPRRLWSCQGSAENQVVCLGCRCKRRSRAAAWRRWHNRNWWRIFWTGLWRCIGSWYRWRGATQGFRCTVESSPPTDSITAFASHDLPSSKAHQVCERHDLCGFVSFDSRRREFA